ncbi:MAG: hypothetical protein MUE72_10070 [Chitinophagaceae bacterium]|jgi:hypothetical protein|nr:hypothetical protein [Chitinophagaceae bacterium]
MLQKSRLFYIISSATLLLSIPLIAMQFTQEVNWTLFDFSIAAILLFGTAIVIELVLRKFKPLKTRLFICAIVLVLLALIWIELAVGIFGSPFAGN